MENTIKLRVKFKKYGAIRYIGHLDVMRFFQKCIRRAEIDVAYSSGYSPHQIMTFAAPLGVGLESNGEYMDIELNSMTNCTDIMNRLNNASVPGIEIVGVCVLPEKAGNAMASVAAAEYTVSFKEGRAPSFSIEEKLNAFLSRTEIPYEKALKKGTRLMDLRPGIFELTWDGKAFHMLLDASSSGNIKPIQVIEAFVAQNNESLMENALYVTRENVYTNIGTEDKRELVPLSVIGTVI